MTRKEALWCLGGALVGGAVTFVLTSNYFTKKIAEETSKAIDETLALMDEDKATINESEKEVPFEPDRIKVTNTPVDTEARKQTANAINYNAIVDQYKPAADKVFYEEHEVESIPEPYEITYDEVGKGPFYYDTENYEYNTEDGIFYDAETGDPVTDVTSKLGRNFVHLIVNNRENEDGTEEVICEIYIRNCLYKKDFCITRICAG